jgi:hypothetical protein
MPMFLNHLYMVLLEILPCFCYMLLLKNASWLGEIDIWEDINTHRFI